MMPEVERERETARRVLAEDGEVTLIDYLAVLPRYWLLIALVAACGVAAAFAHAASQPPTFEARATLLIQPDLYREVTSRPALGAGDLGGSSNVILSLVTPAPAESMGRWNPTYAALLQNRKTAAAALDSLAAEFPELARTSPDDFVRYAVRAQEVRDTNLVNLFVRLPSAEAAARAANALAERVASLDRDLQQQHAVALRDVLDLQAARAREHFASVGQGASASAADLALAREAYMDLARRAAAVRVHAAAGVGRLQLVDPATVPLTPVAPRPFRSVAIGLTAGVIAGVLLAFALDYLRRPTSPLRSRSA